MSNAKPDKTLVTAQDVNDYLWDLFCKKRYCRIENDFHFDLITNRLQPTHASGEGPCLQRVPFGCGLRF
jgi:hypothetical protein